MEICQQKIICQKFLFTFSNSLPLKSCLEKCHRLYRLNPKLSLLWSSLRSLWIRPWKSLTMGRNWQTLTRLRSVKMSFHKSGHIWPMPNYVIHWHVRRSFRTTSYLTSGYPKSLMTLCILVMHSILNARCIIQMHRH